MAQHTEEYLTLSLPEANKVQQVVGTFLYYICEVNPTMLVLLNIIVGKQDNSTKAMSKALVQLLNYSVIHLEGITIYNYSVVAPHIHNNASLLSDPVPRSQR